MTQKTNRVFDRESFDPAELRGRLDQFLHRIQALFVHRKCLSTSSYSAVAVEQLSVRRMAVLEGTPRAIGGFSKDEAADAIEKSMSKFAN